MAMIGRWEFDENGKRVYISYQDYPFSLYLNGEPCGQIDGHEWLTEEEWEARILERINDGWYLQPGESGYFEVCELQLQTIKFCGHFRVPEFSVTA